MAFPDIATLRTYVNTFIVPNGLNLITGQEANDSFNGVIDFIIKTMPNYNKAQIFSTGGVVVINPLKPVAIITAPVTSVQWIDDFMNEYYIVNATNGSVALAGGFNYIDAFATTQTTIPANTAIHIAKADNNSWFLVNNEGGTGGGGVPPVTGHAGQVLSNNGTVTTWKDTHITIGSSDFQVDGVTYLNADIGTLFKVSVYSPDVPNFLYPAARKTPAEWQYVTAPNGIKILVPWFNAHTNPNLILELFFKGINTSD